MNDFQKYLEENTGEAKRIARVLGISPVAVCKWKLTGIVPARRAPDVEYLTGISRYRLNPEAHGVSALAARDISAVLKTKDTQT